jgi:hypothetical protein
MKKVIAILAVAFLTIAAGRPAGADGFRAKVGGQEKKARSFSMGVTAFPYDLTPEAVEATQLWILDNTDIVSIKLDEGVPWQEALENKNAYDPGFEASLEGKSRYPKDKRVFLSMTPLNKDKNGMAGYRGALENMPNPDPWNKKDLDDPLVAKAYLNFCREMVRRFRPDYLAYGIEVNNLAKAPAKWKKFVPFAKDIYAALKKDFPQMPVLMTLSTESVTFDPEQSPLQKKAIKEILPFTDMIAVTALPYIKEQNPAKIPKDYFAQMAALAPQKPFAIAETAFLAEDVNFLGIERVGKPAWQQDYLKFCFDECSRLNAKFIIWMLPRDCDALYERIPAPINEILKLFKDTGLLDGEGKPRKSFELWSQWLKMPRLKG